MYPNTVAPTRLDLLNVIATVGIDAGFISNCRHGMLFGP